MKEFFGFGGYSRPAEGYFSWQHLLFVSTLMVIMVVLAIVLGLKNKKKDDKTKNKVLVWAAILIDGFELLKIILICARSSSIEPLTRMLPLFLCSIQLITIPLAAFAKGRLKETALDFVFIFGLAGAILGTYGAGQNYNAYPVISLDNVVSGITHAISGFASLYIGISKMISMRLKNMWISFVILGGFCTLALIANYIIPYNYMFLNSHDGTPYQIVYNLVGGIQVLYTIMVILLFVVWIAAYYFVFYLLRKRKNKKAPLLQNTIKE